MAKQSTQALTDEAASWFVAMQRVPLAPEERAAFDTWIESDPAHAVAYARVELAWERAERLRADPAPCHRPAFRLAPTAMSRRSAIAAGLAALLAGGTGLWSVLRPQAFETRVGERRRVVLDDGSVVHLNTDTRIEVQFAKDRRDIRLARGEALFEVAHDKTRPFVVAAGDTAVRAVGTAFNVRLRETLVEVTVTEGVVAISDRTAPQQGAARPPSRTISATPAAGQLAAAQSAPMREIAAGGGAVAGPGTVTPLQLDADALRARVAWRDGLIQFNGETLEQAVAEFNRYRTGALVIGDPRLAGIRVGGSFEIDESDKFLSALQAGFHIRAMPGAGGTVYLMPAS